MNTRNLFFVSCGAVLAGLLILAIPHCRNVPSDPGSHFANKPPDTRLSNLPVNDSTGEYIRQGRIPEKTLQWVGDDEDGFIVAYRVRWTDSTFVGGTMEFLNTTPWTTVLNITSLGEERLDTLILVQGTPGSIFRMYNFFATLDPGGGEAQDLRDRIRDSLATGRPFAVPHHTGVIVGDSVVGANPLNFEAPTKGSFIFASPGERNKHRFEVASIDNNDVADVTPAYLYFWTLPSDTPIVSINAVPAGLNYIVRYPTERNPGLDFAFGALDPSTSDIVFSWAVDTVGAPESTLRWSDWNPDPVAVVSALDLRQIFRDTLALSPRDTHTFHVRARNRWGVVSPRQDTIFLARVPPLDDPNWPEQTLVIVNNRTNLNFAGSVDSNLVKAFYSDVLTTLGKSYTFWVTGTPHPPRGSFAMPPIDILARYTSVLLLFEQSIPFSPIQEAPDYQRQITGLEQDTLRLYLSVGGNLIYSGIPAKGPTVDSTLRVTTDLHFGDVSFFSQWYDEVFHVNVPLYVKSLELDFLGARGLAGYPDIWLDTSKVPADSGYALRYVALNYPRGFGEAISVFQAADTTGRFYLRPVGVRYLAAPVTPPQRKDYSVVHFGFPLYYAQRNDVVQALQKAYEDIDE